MTDYKNVREIVIPALAAQTEMVSKFIDQTGRAPNPLEVDKMIHVLVAAMAAGQETKELRKQAVEFFLDPKMIGKTVGITEFVRDFIKECGEHIELKG